MLTTYEITQMIRPWKRYIGAAIQGTATPPAKAPGKPIYPAKFSGTLVAVYSHGLLIKQARTRLWIDATDLAYRWVQITVLNTDHSPTVLTPPPLVKQSSDDDNPLRKLAALLA